jgi:hypothetical protein
LTIRCHRIVAAPRPIVTSGHRQANQRAGGQPERVGDDGVTTIRRSFLAWLDTGRSQLSGAASSIC